MESISLAFQETVSLKDTSTNDLIVKIRVDDQELCCPKKLLVQHSKYFEAYFAFSQSKDQAQAEKKSQEIIVQLKGGIDFESIKTIWDGLSNPKGVIEIDEENVQSILQASTFLQCRTAEIASADYMLSKLSLSNAYSVFLLALTCGSNYLATASENFILEQTRSLRLAVTSVMDLLQTTLESIKGAINKIDDNYIAFCTACGWVLYDLEERASYLGDLLDEVIVEIIPPDALIMDGLEDHPVLKKAQEMSIQYEALPLRAKINYWENTSKNRSKWPKLGIVCSTGNNVSIIAYRKYGRWLKLTIKPAKLKSKSSGSAVVEINHCLYFLGGIANMQMWNFSLRNDAWKCLSPEQDERIRPLVCSDEGRGSIYIFGGYTDRYKEVRYFDTAAKFDTLSSKWEMLSPMTHARSGGQACFAQDKIYLFGGLCSRRRVVVSCEVYDIALDTYHHLTDLPAMISDFGLVLIGDSTVYMIGGMDPITFETKDTVFTYDLKTGKWDRFSPLNVARKSCACFYDGNDLYAAGGATAELDQLSSVEKYDSNSQRWELVDNLPKGLAASVTAVVAEMPVRLMLNYPSLAQSNMS